MKKKRDKIGGAAALRGAASLGGKFEPPLFASSSSLFLYFTRRKGPSPSEAPFPP